MTPPRENSSARKDRQHQQQKQEERNNNNTEMRAEAIEQRVRSNSEFIVVDLITQNTNMGDASEVNNNNDDNNNNASVINDIQAAAASVAVDSRDMNNVNDFLILHYEHSDDGRNSGNTNNGGVENGLLHFNSIHLRNNNNSPENHTNSFASEQTQSYHLAVPPEGISDNARSAIFQPSVSAINGSSLVVCHHDLPAPDSIANNPVTVVDRTDVVERREHCHNGQEVERVQSGVGAEAGGGDGVVGNSTHALFAPQYNAVTTPISDHFGGVNSAFVQIATGVVGGELVAQEYLQQQQTQHNSCGRRRRRRRHRGGRGRDGHRQWNQIRRSLKSMNKILRKTVYTLRRIKSLIMQQVQMARDYHMNLPMTL